MQLHGDNLRAVFALDNTNTRHRSYIQQRRRRKHVCIHGEHHHTQHSMMRRTQARNTTTKTMPNKWLSLSALQMRCSKTSCARSVRHTYYSSVWFRTELTAHTQHLRVGCKNYIQLTRTYVRFETMTYTMIEHMRVESTSHADLTTKVCGVKTT